MNAMDILRYGHQIVEQALDGLPDAAWTVPGACGEWSVQDILAHLASFELLLVDVLHSVLREGPTLTLTSFIAGPEQFNTREVSQRRGLLAHEVWEEYEGAYRKTLTLLAQVPIRVRRLNGTLPWYGVAYDLEDFIVYTAYGHKREHCAQIAAFREQWSQRAQR